MTTPDLDPNVFIENLNTRWEQAFANYPYEHVAWSMDGTTVLAHSPTIDGLIDEVGRLGIKDFVADYLVPGDEADLASEFNSGTATAAETNSEEGE
jgi:hypothetical protein